MPKGPQFKSLPNCIHYKLRYAEIWTSHSPNNKPGNYVWKAGSVLFCFYPWNPLEVFTALDVPRTKLHHETQFYAIALPLFKANLPIYRDILRLCVYLHHQQCPLCIASLDDEACTLMFSHKQCLTHIAAPWWGRSQKTEGTRVHKAAQCLDWVTVSHFGRRRRQWDNIQPAKFGKTCCYITNT